MARTAVFFPGVHEVERRTSAADNPPPPSGSLSLQREKQGQDDEEDFQEGDLSILGKSRGGGHWTGVIKRTLRCLCVRKFLNREKFG